jgi:D-inositol-3-phosphate glycosyltransferase
MGIPTIASPLNHFRESIRHGETGLIVPDNSEAAWTEAIELLITDEKMRDTIGRNARAEIKANWSPAVMAQKYKKALGVICNAKYDAERLGDEDRASYQRSGEPAVH